MKIISWNVCVTNFWHGRIIKEITKQDGDIVCLQEISHKLLDKVKKIEGYHLYYDRIAEGRREKRDVYRVIMSKFDITGKKSFQTLKKEPKTIWAKLVKFFYGIRQLNTKGIYADIDGKIRVMNLHLDATVSPRKRVEQFTKALEHMDRKKPTIICGDFNSYGAWYYNIAPIIFMNLHPRDFFYDENKEFQELFRKHNLHDIFFRMKTVNFMTLFRIHADYILVPNGLKVHFRKVHKRFGSDHHMIIAEVAI
jgi:endonuclease/exonuclease/phosphatase family metal-dependent hydrolase